MDVPLVLLTQMTECFVMNVEKDYRFRTMGLAALLVNKMSSTIMMCV